MPPVTGLGAGLAAAELMGVDEAGGIALAASRTVESISLLVAVATVRISGKLVGHFVS
jgi:hypothetical protein